MRPGLAHYFNIKHFIHVWLSGRSSCLSPSTKELHGRAILFLLECVYVSSSSSWSSCVSILWQWPCLRHAAGVPATNLLTQRRATSLKKVGWLSDGAAVEAEAEDPSFSYKSGSSDLYRGFVSISKLEVHSVRAGLTLWDLEAASTQLVKISQYLDLCPRNKNNPYQIVVPKSCNRI